MENQKLFVAYFRLSKEERDKQQIANGEDALGMQAQKKEVRAYVQSVGGKIIESFTEIISGTRKNRVSRRGALAALQLCKQTGAALIVHKVARLARDVEFAVKIKNSGIEVIALDNPNQSAVLFGILAVLAENESKEMGDRVKRTINIKKERGEPLGFRTHKNPVPKWNPLSVQMSIATRKAQAENNAHNRTGIAMACALRQQGMGHKKIAEKMNSQGFLSPKGKPVNMFTVIAWLETAQKRGEGQFFTSRKKRVPIHNPNIV